MLHWLPTLFVTICLLLFAIPTLAMAIAVAGMAAGRMLYASYLLATERTSVRFQQWTGAMMAGPVWIVFAWMFGMGAWMLGSMVIDGFIGRFL